ncbi:helix-turn-helix domain-containing protein [Hyphomonas pacifica]|uniref:helix-turn-helix domain-containing protein n=1 Tax=Hyphomonas pacifica TaxID=1280941 RepID=UPI0019D70A82|nr:helix-turn-helix transcriptional regulator [Hyphomonas pacifica]
MRRIRVSKGVSQERLAFDANVDRSYLGGLERGEHNPTVDVLERVAKVLDVPLRDLFTDYDPEVGDIEGLPPGRKSSEA